jgi:hypothetical protein
LNDTLLTEIKTSFRVIPIFARSEMQSIDDAAMRDSDALGPARRPPNRRAALESSRLVCDNPRQPRTSTIMNMIVNMVSVEG